MDSSNTYKRQHLSLFRCFQFLLTALFVDITSVFAQNQTQALPSSNSKLMVILLGGFSWDYLKYGDNFGEEFYKILNDSYYVHHLMPVFPSETYPNLYSLLTGLYPENNGFISNVMHDPKYRAEFHSFADGDGASPYWWNESIPIWATSTQQNKTTYVYNWPGCSVSVNGSRPVYCQPPISQKQLNIFEGNLKDALIRLKNKEADFVLIYTTYLDMIGHDNGPRSKEIMEAVKTIDNRMGNLLNEIEGDRILKNELNVIILSDHGVVDYPKAENRFSLRDFLNMDDIIFVTGSGVVVGIYPVMEKLNQVYKSLKNITWANVWKTQDIPSQFHIKMNARAPPILLVTKPGYVVEPIPDPNKQIPKIKGVPREHQGVNGYDPRLVPEMNGILLASGPDIKPNITTRHVNMVDVYNMMTCILNITGIHNNGTWGNICDLLLNTTCNNKCLSNNVNLSMIPNLLIITFGFILAIKLQK